MKKGLVVEGGGLRGAYSAGALSWLIDNNVHFDYGIGMSISALYVFCLFTKNKELLKEVPIRIAGQPDVGIKAIIKEGQVVAYDKMFKQVLNSPNALDVNKLNKIEEYAETGIFDTKKGEIEWVNHKTITPDLLKAKAATVLPFFGKKVKVENTAYLDGGIYTMIPIERAISQKCDKYLIITTKSADYVRKPYSKPIMKAFKMVYSRIPNLYNLLDQRVSIYTHEKEIVEKLEQDNKAIHLFPSIECGVGRFSGTIEQLESLFNIGYSDMENRKEEILKFFGE